MFAVGKLALQQGKVLGYKGMPNSEWLKWLEWLSAADNDDENDSFSSSILSHFVAAESNFVYVFCGLWSYNTHPTNAILMSD